MNRYEVRDWLKGRLHRIGYDVITYRSGRSLAGQIGAVLPGLGVDAVLDVGANVGQYGTLLRSVGYRGLIVSFEPVADVHARLQSRAAGDGRWITANTALGSARGTAEINVTRGSDLSSMRAPLDTEGRSLTGAIRVERTETIAIARLDELVDQYIDPSATRRLFLKCDTQGWDLEVLEGATGASTASWRCRSSCRCSRSTRACRAGSTRSPTCTGWVSSRSASIR